MVVIAPADSTVTFPWEFRSLVETVPVPVMVMSPPPAVNCCVEMVEPRTLIEPVAVTAELIVQAVPEVPMVALPMPPQLKPRRNRLSSLLRVQFLRRRA